MRGDEREADDPAPSVEDVLEEMQRIAAADLADLDDEDGPLPEPPPSDGGAPIALTQRRPEAPRRARDPLPQRDSGIPKVADLKQRTLASVSPPSARLHDDALFRSTALQEDVFASSIRAPDLAPPSADPPRAPEHAAERDRADARPSRRPPAGRGPVMYASVLAFVLGVATTLAVERIIAPPAPVAPAAHADAAPPATVAPERVPPRDAPAPPSSGDPELVDDWSRGAPATPPAASVAPWPSEIATRDGEPATATPAAGEDAPGEFDAAAAQAAVATAALTALGCADGEHHGRVPMSITFDNSGHVIRAVMSGHSPLAGTAVAGCIARTLQTARVPPFKGPPVTVTRTVTIP